MTKTKTYAPSRRHFFLGVALSAAAATTFADLTPAHGNEAPLCVAGTGAPIALAAPPYNANNHWLGYTVPIYSGQSPWRVLQKGSLPEYFTITNTTDQPIHSPTGTISLQMKDTGSDYDSVGGANKTRVNSTNRNVTFKDLGNNAQGARHYAWQYRNVTLKPGQSINVPLRYYVNYPFANVDYELLVSATLDGAAASTAAIGVVPGFARWLIWD